MLVYIIKCMTFIPTFYIDNSPRYLCIMCILVFWVCKAATFLLEQSSVRDDNVDDNVAFLIYSNHTICEFVHAYVIVLVAHATHTHTIWLELELQFSHFLFWHYGSLFQKGRTWCLSYSHITNIHSNIKLAHTHTNPLNNVQQCEREF